MILNLLSFTLGGFHLGSSLLSRSLNGLWGDIEGYNYPLTVSIMPKNITIAVNPRSNTAVIDQ